MHELSFASLTWREAPMPGAPAIEMALLPRLPDGGFRAFVRFPKGWARPDVGHYAVAEEFVVLEGALSLNGQMWNAGAPAWIPAFQRRQDLGSATGCLVFAWFGGTPRWIPGEPTQPPSQERHRSWIEHGCFFRQMAPDAPRETLELNGWTWRYGNALRASSRSA
jgi:hypothetical protein